MDNILKVGIIGVGTIGKTHLQTFIAQNNVKVAAIADINRDALKSAREKFDVEKSFTNYRDLLALDELDSVAVCTPPFNHATITCDAASAGKHVLCEKPMAMNSREANEMVKACNKAEVKLGICSARIRFDPSVELAKEYISKGKLGRIYYARVTSLRRRGRPGIDILKDSKWFLDASKAGGGALIDIGCYDIDLMLYLLGDAQPISVSALTFRGIGKHPKIEATYDVEEHSSVFVKFEDNLAVTFETAWASNITPSREAIIFGSKGALKLEPFTYFAERNNKGVATAIDLPRDAGSWSRLIEDFVTACLENHKPKTPGEEGLKAMQIIDMAYRSAKFSREVNIEELSIS